MIKEGGESYISCGRIDPSPYPETGLEELWIYCCHGMIVLCLPPEHYERDIKS